MKLPSASKMIGVPAAFQRFWPKRAAAYPFLLAETSQAPAGKVWIANCPVESVKTETRATPEPRRIPSRVTLDRARCHFQHYLA